MNEEQTPHILAVIQRAPLWIRHDLAVREDGTRLRAEETLAAMIADALGRHAVASEASQG